jgi:hypothetical protein
VTNDNRLRILVFPNEIKSARNANSSVNVFVLRMGFMQFLSIRRNQYTLQYLSKEDECKTVCQSLSTLNVSQFIKITCLQFI